MKQRLLNGRATGAGVAVFGIRPIGMWVDGELDAFEEPTKVYCDGLELKEARNNIALSREAGRWAYDASKKALYVSCPGFKASDLCTIEIE